jgi:hypothetical protein
MLLAKHHRERVNLIAATVVVPPAGQYDREADRRLSPSEHIKEFGGRMRTAFGGRPFFIDASYLDNSNHQVPGYDHPLVELYERAKLLGARPAACVRLGASAAYRSAAARVCKSNPDRPCGIKLGVNDLESVSIRDDLDLLLDELGLEPSQCVLFIDIGDELEGDPIEISEVLVEQINIIPRLQEWLQLVFQMGSFPAKDGLKAGEFSEFQRLDWQVYEAMATGQRLLRRPTFGDYGVDAPGQIGGGGRAVAKLHYSDMKNYYVEKGLITTKGAKLANIVPVARRLVGRKIFAGKQFSEGDKKIFDLSVLNGGTGHASTWRWAGLDHHATLTMDAICQLFGFKELPKNIDQDEKEEVVQPDFFLSDEEL